MYISQNISMEELLEELQESLCSLTKCFQLTVTPALLLAILQAPALTRTSILDTTHLRFVLLNFCSISSVQIVQSYVLPVETISVQNFTLYEDLALNGDQTSKPFEASGDIQADGYYFDAASSTSVDQYEDFSVSSQTRPLYDYELPLVFEPLVIKAVTAI